MLPFLIVCNDCRHRVMGMSQAWPQDVKQADERAPAEPKGEKKKAYLELISKETSRFQLQLHIFA